MGLLFTYVIRVLNCLFLVGGLYSVFKGADASFGWTMDSRLAWLTETATVTIPFLTTALFAFGYRPVWIRNVAFAVNCFVILGLIALGYFDVFSGGGKAAFGIIISGSLVALNLLYLLFNWDRVTRTSALAYEYERDETEAAK